MIEVQLTASDVRWADRVAQLRVATAKGRSRFDEATSPAGHILGARGELAFCRGLDFDWPASVGTYRTEPDVPPNWEVRASIRPQLKVSTDDPADIFVAAVQAMDRQQLRFQIHGYCIALWAKLHYPLTDPHAFGRPAYFVPFYKLVPIDPGFHDLHAMYRWADGWGCAWCPYRRM